MLGCFDALQLGWFNIRQISACPQLWVTASCVGGGLQLDIVGALLLPWLWGRVAIDLQFRIIRCCDNHVVLLCKPVYYAACILCRLHSWVSS